MTGNIRVSNMPGVRISYTDSFHIQFDWGSVYSYTSCGNEVLRRRWGLHLKTDDRDKQNGAINTVGSCSGTPCRFNKHTGSFGYTRFIQNDACMYIFRTLLYVFFKCQLSYETLEVYNIDTHMYLYLYLKHLPHNRYMYWIWAYLFNRILSIGFLHTCVYVHCCILIRSSKYENNRNDNRESFSTF